MIAETRQNRSELAQNMDYLRQLAPFERTPFEILRLYAYIARRRRFRQGDFIFRQNQQADRAHLILSGEVTLAVEKSGRTLPLQVLGPMEFFGYMALLARYDWPLSARATTASETLSVDRESFRKILIRFPDQCIEVVDSLVRLRMQRMREHLDTLMKTIQDGGGGTELARDIGV
jgi:CRP-like cAMP-binding protein